MSSVSREEAAKGFDKVLMLARDEPVQVRDNDEDVVVIISPDTYRPLLARGGRLSPTPLRQSIQSRAKWLVERKAGQAASRRLQIRRSSMRHAMPDSAASDRAIADALAYGTSTGFWSGVPAPR
ncbi:MAG: hypothetical protein SV862_11925 [Pseudomonadota bacterium]|nr:hypothetical protein [Pseudomonadota bacterium]